MTIDRTDNHLQTVYGWLQDMPEWYLKLTGRKGESFYRFIDDIEYDIKFTLLVDDKPEAFVTAEDKGNGYFDVHIFTPRRQTPEIVSDTILLLRDELRTIKRVLWCVFSFPIFERTVERPLLEFGSVDSGWRYRKSGVTYKTLIWNAKTV